MAPSTLPRALRTAAQTCAYAAQSTSLAESLPRASSTLSSLVPAATRSRGHTSLVRVGGGGAATAGRAAAAAAPTDDGEDAGTDDGGGAAAAPTGGGGAPATAPTGGGATPTDEEELHSCDSGRRIAPELRSKLSPSPNRERVTTRKRYVSPKPLHISLANGARSGWHPSRRALSMHVFTVDTYVR